MEVRRNHIDRLLAAFSVGDFNPPLRLSERLDDSDAVTSLVYMLGEELKTATVSRDRFNDILDTVSDMVLVVSAGGLIEDVNAAVCRRLGYLKRALVGLPVEVLTGGAKPSLLRQLRTGRGPEGQVRIWNRSFLTVGGETFPVEIRARPLGAAGMKGRPSILVTVRDTGGLLRAVMEGQEAERMRLARDLHDGLGQQLAALKYLVGMAAKEPDGGQLRMRLEAAGESIVDMMGTMNGICYNLMPKTLEDFGVVEAVRELGERVERTGMMRVRVKADGGLPVLPRALQVDLFRVIQEFLSNSMRHGEATVMQVFFGGRGREVEIRLVENGRGFDPARVGGRGTGIRNMESRVLLHGGAFFLMSRPGRGTEGRIRLTIN